MPIARVQLPDGRIGRFEVLEGTTPDQVTQFVNQQMDAKQSVPEVQQPEDKDFLGNVAEDMRKRGATQANIVNATNTGEQNALRGAWQSITNQVGAANDIVGQSISSLAKTGFEVLSSDTQQGLSEYATRLKSTPLGQTLAKGVQAYGENQAAFEKENPNLGRDLAGIREVATFAMPGGTGTIAKGVVKGVAGAAKGVGSIGNAAADLARARAKRISEAPIPLSPAMQMREYAGGLYKKVDEIGANTIPQATDDFLEEISSFKPRSKKAQLLAGERPVDELIKIFNTFKGQSILLSEADEMDKILGAKVTKYYTTKGLDADGHAILSLQDKFREHIANPKPGMIEGGAEGYKLRLEANKAWSKSKLLDDIEAIENNADAMDNPAMSRKAGYRVLMRNKQRFNRYSPGEKALIKKGAKGGNVANLLRTTLGSRLMSIMVGSMGGGLGGAAAGAGISAVARGIADRSGANVTRTLQNKIINK